MAAKTSASVRRKIERLARKGLSSRQIAAELGVHDTTVCRYMPADTKRRAGAKAAPIRRPGRADDVGRDRWNISIPETRIHTLDEMLEHCAIDLDVWEVERFICNKWEVGAADKREGKLHGIIVEPLFQVKVWLKRKAVQASIRAEVEHLKAQAEKYSPIFAPAFIHMRSRYNSGVMVEHSLYDHHFGAMIWGKETGRADYDLPIAKESWHKAIAANCDRTDPYNPDTCLFVVGNDQQNADNRQGSTEKGTPQSMDARYQKVYDVSRDATVWAAEQFLARYARVHVVIVGGNHDPLSAFHLGDYLKAWFRRHKRLTVDNGPAFRKWFEWGTVGLGFCHGNAGKLEEHGMKMAAERADMWGRTQWHEIHTGDKHHRRLIEFDAYTVRILPSLRPPCAWSAENGYGAIRAAESYVWSKTEALIGTSTFSILPGQLADGKNSHV
jgi:transposase